MASQFGLAIGSALSSLFRGHSDSAKESYLYSRALQQHQYELNRKTRQTAYQDTRYSLEQADFNPLLAVGQQAQGGTFGATMNVTDPKTENLQNALNVAQANSAIRLNSAQAYNQLMQGRLTTAQASNLISQSQLNSAQRSLTNLQSSAQAIQNLHLPQQIKSQIRLNNSQAQASLINAQAGMISANANQVSAQANVQNANTNRYNAFTNAWRIYNPVSTTSVGFGPAKFSHTGNPLIQTKTVY